MIETNNIVPFAATHPGEILDAELDARGIKQKNFAKSIGISTTHLNEFIKGHRKLSADLAIKLEQGLGIPSDFWMSAESNYELTCAKIRNHENRNSVESPSSILFLSQENGSPHKQERLLLVNKILAILDLRGISQNQFASMLNRPVAEILEVLSGDKDFSVDMLFDMGVCLGCDFLQLPEITTIEVPTEDSVTHIRTSEQILSYDENLSCPICDKWIDINFATAA